MSTDPVVVANAAHARACLIGDPEKIAVAKRGVTEAKLRRAVDEALAAFPPLTDEVKDQIAHLLRTGGQ
jgi:hypothetical protein